MSLSLGLSLFKSSLWSVQDRIGEKEANQTDRKWETRWKEEWKTQKKERLHQLQKDTCKLECVWMHFPPLWTIPNALYHLHHSVSIIICLSFFCLHTTAWLCPGTDGLVCGTATGSKNLTEHRYRAGFSSNAGVKHLTNFSTKPALFRSILAWTWTPAKVWKLFVWTA